MNRFLTAALVVALALTQVSCRRAAEKAAEKIRVEGIEQVTRHGLTGIDITVRIANGTAHKLVLDAADMDIYYADSRVANVVLREGVEIAPRLTASIETRWQVKIADPIALYVLLRKVSQDDLSQVFVSFRAEGRGGPMPVNISRERMPLSEFLNTFGLTLEDVKNYVKA